MGVDLEKKRKLLLYPIEYQRGCPCEWVLEFARVGDCYGAGPHTMLMLHSALQCCAPFLECIQHSVHSKSLALKCTRHSVQLT